MAGPVLAYEYRYRHASSLLRRRPLVRRHLRLATSSDRGEPHPHFFQGRLRRPGRAADLLRGLVDVVQSGFDPPPAAGPQRFLGQADPVVTGSGEILRFETFSACCSTYGRVDLLPESIDGTWHGRGTTNVDFNVPMCAVLARVRDSNDVGLAVGNDEVILSRDGESVVERKVALPIRWLKGFVEVVARTSPLHARVMREVRRTGSGRQGISLQDDREHPPAPRTAERVVCRDRSLPYPRRSRLPRGSQNQGQDRPRRHGPAGSPRSPWIPRVAHDAETRLSPQAASRGRSGGQPWTRSFAVTAERCAFPRLVLPCTLFLVASSFQVSRDPVLSATCSGRSAVARKRSCR